MKSPRVVRFAGSSKSLAALSCLCAVPYFFGATAAQAQFKVASVDMAKIFSAYYKTVDYNATVTAAREAAQKEINGPLEKHHRLLEEMARLEKDIADPALDVPLKAERRKQRGDKTQEIQSLQQEIADLKNVRQRNLQELSARARNKVVEDIMIVVNARVATDHYDLVLNKSGQGVGGKALVLYTSDRIEITDDVIRTLNQNRPGPAATSPAPAASPAN